MTVGLKRVILIILTVVVQVSIFVLLFLIFPESEKILKYMLLFLAVIIGITIVSSDMKPDYKLPWIILIFIAPIVGAILFIMSKRSYVKYTKKKYDKIHKQHRERMETEGVDIDEVKKNDHIKRGVTFLNSIAEMPCYNHTQSKYFPLGEDMWEDMLKELKQAKHFIFMEYFIVQEGIMFDSILEILRAKVKEGVEVRFMFDSFGSLFTAPSNLVKNLEKEGIQCVAFNSKIEFISSAYNNRDHRKICVIDNRVGFTGGANIADEYINKKIRFGHWKDTAMKLSGEAVWSFTVMFLDLWDMSTGKEDDYHRYKMKYEVESNDDEYYIPYTEIPGDGLDIASSVYYNMIESAEDYIYIMTPYLILDYQMIYALTNAAKSGIDVKIMLPGIPDKKAIYSLSRSYYHVLAKEGVKIYEYTPGFLHAKQFISDDKKAIIGTINLDYRSLTHHLEDAVWVYNADSVIDMKTDYLKTLEVSRRVELSEIKDYGVKHNVLLPILRLLAPML